MPYPESCPECGSQFRNTGTHFTARRNEVGRHVLLELGCQNTNRRYWWDFTAGQLGEDARPAPVLVGAASARPSSASNGTNASNGSRADVNASGSLGTRAGLNDADSVVASAELSATASGGGHEQPPHQTQPHEPARRAAHPEPSGNGTHPDPAGNRAQLAHSSNGNGNGHVSLTALDQAEAAPPQLTPVIRMTTTNEPVPAAAEQPNVLKDAFVRQLQLDRMTLRQMRSLLMSDDARRAIEVAIGATEATYERLALILFGTDLPELLGKAAVAPTAPVMSAEERLELQREKARIRARLRRAAIKAAKNTGA